MGRRGDHNRRRARRERQAIRDQARIAPRYDHPQTKEQIAQDEARQARRHFLFTFRGNRTLELRFGPTRYAFDEDGTIRDDDGQPITAARLAEARRGKPDDLC